MATMVTVRRDTKTIMKCIRCTGRGGMGGREIHKEVSTLLATSPL